MELIIRHFTELSTEELYEIYRLRIAVFVVEQRCPYQEIDAFDKTRLSSLAEGCRRHTGVCAGAAAAHRL